MFLIDGKDHLATVSPAFAEWLSYERETLTGRAFATVVSETSGDLTATAGAVGDAEDAVARAASGRLVTRDGDHLPVEVEFVSTPSLAPGTVVGTVRRVGEYDRHAAINGAAGDRFGALFELIGDAVIEVEIVDATPIVRTVNPGFETVFGYDPKTVVGESLNEFIVPERRVGEAVEFDQRTAEGKENYAVVTRKTARGLREFLYRGIPYDRGDGGQYGLAIYTDITEQKRRKRGHEVIQRVLRHNLRNALNVILGGAEDIASQADGDLSEQARLLTSAARDLGTLTERVRQIERVFDSDLDRYTVEMTDICRQIATTYDADTPATVETDLPDRLPAVAGEFLPVAVEELVTNAVEHAGDAPHVFVSGRRDGDVVVLRIEDDGPGIPTQERAAVFDEEISQLSHGTGLGLWVAKWAVESYGGRLAYDRGDGRTAVVVTLPAVVDG